MKNLIASIFILFLSGSLLAQVNFGIKGGLNLPDIKVKNFTPDINYEDLEVPNRTYGFHAGIFFKIDAKVLFIQPEILYTRVDQSLMAIDVPNIVPKELAVNLNRLDIPIMVGKELGPLRLMAGPIYSANISSNSEAWEDEIEEGTLGYQVGFGFEISKIIIDFRYEGPFSQTASAIIIEETGYETDLRVNQLIVSLAYKFN